MKKNIHVFTILFFLVYCKVNFSQNYCTSSYLTNNNSYTLNDIDTITNIPYGNALNNLGLATALKLDLYTPSPSSDPLPKHPLVILVHGGGFKGGNKNAFKEMASMLALKGYVAASIDYRLGWNSGTSSCDGDSADLKLAIYRAVQDLNASIRFLKQNAATYRIDTNFVFVGGSSAGAGTCLWSHYFTQTDFNNWIPNVQSLLGAVNTSGNTIVMSNSINGISNMWGCLSDTSYINVSNAVPTISFHGDNDHVIPIDTGRFNFCTNPLTIKMHGSRAIYYKLQNINKCTELNVEIGGPHGVYNDTLLTERTACFFRSIICAGCSTVNNTNTVNASCAITLAVNEYDKAKIIIYPNPANESIFIKGVEQGNTIQIYDALGKMISETKSNSQINISELNSGMYFVLVKTKNGNVMHSKFVKE